MNRRELFREAFIAGYKAGKKRLNEGLPVANAAQTQEKPNPVVSAVKKGVKAVGDRAKLGVKQFKYSWNNGLDYDVDGDEGHLIDAELERCTKLAKKNGQIDLYAVVANFGKDQNFVKEMTKFLKENDVISNDGPLVKKHVSGAVYKRLQNWFELNKDSIPDDNGDKLHTTNYLRARKHMEDGYGEGSWEGTWSYDDLHDERREIKVMADQITDRIFGVCGFKSRGEHFQGLINPLF